MTARGNNSFEQAITKYNRVVKTQPIAQAALMSTLGAANRAGEAQIKSDELGKVNFANQMVPLYSGSLTLNEQGHVQPPFSEAQVSELQGRLDTLRLFTDGNGETGSPTNSNDIPTGERK